MSVDSRPGPWAPSPTPHRTFADMSHAEVREWANEAYRSQNQAFAHELSNTPDAVVARDFGVAATLAARLKAAVGGLNVRQVA